MLGRNLNITLIFMSYEMADRYWTKFSLKLKRPGSKLAFALVYLILWFKIIDMENLSHHEWLHDYMHMQFLIYLLIGADEVRIHSLLRFFMWINMYHSIKYTRQMPSLIQVFWEKPFYSRVSLHFPCKQILLICYLQNL